MKPSLNRSLLALAAFAAGAAGCATAPPGDPPIGPSAADNHRIKVAEVGERMELPVAANDLTLSAAAQQDLIRFARAYSAGGHGPLMLETPSGGANATAASRMAQQARMILTENGVPYGAVAGATYDAAAAGEAAPLRLSFSRFEATGPECAPIWTQDLAHPVGNAEYASFGCSAVANLAALVADPHDLIAPRDETPRDGGRRAAVMKHYREGEQTHAVRTQDERISVSDAVN